MAADAYNVWGERYADREAVFQRERSNPYGAGGCRSGAVVMLGAGSIAGRGRGASKVDGGSDGGNW
jgi:hypothetical protein